MTTQPSDVTIFLERRGDEYRARYEIRVAASAETIQRIRQRMLQSFSLGRSYPDARSVGSIRQKGRLMQMVFQSNFGYRADIVEVFN